MRLLSEIQNAAVDANVPLANVLRKCAVLGAELKNDELRDWALRELNGYQDGDDVPEYRRAQSQVFGNVAGPFGSGFKNVAIPALAMPEHLREMSHAVVLSQGVAGLTELLEMGDIRQPMPGDWLIAVQQHGSIQGNLYAAWRPLSKSVVVDALDAIRNRILEFCLRIAPEIPETLTADTAAEAGPAVTQVLNQVIFGSYTGNTANASPSVRQTVVIQSADLEGLARVLKDAGVPPSDTDALRAAIEEDGRPSEPGPKCREWLKRAGDAVSSGTWSLAQGVTIATIRDAVLSHLRGGS